jgi:hypothetical protein
MNELLYSPKIKPEHLGRKAIVYLRQSSDKQVRQNLESQRLQYESSGANPLGRMRSAFAVFQRSQTARTAAQISGAVPGLPDNFPILN